MKRERRRRGGSRRRMLGAALAAAVLAAACVTMGGEDRGVAGTPSVRVLDQPVTGITVKVAEAVSPGPGWVAIYSDRDGRPGALLGYTHLDGGDRRNVSVGIDRTRATTVLHAMLHLDNGVYGRFEFPGADAPVSIDGKVVVASFQVLR